MKKSENNTDKPLRHKRDHFLQDYAVFFHCEGKPELDHLLVDLYNKDGKGKAVLQ